MSFLLDTNVCVQYLNGTSTTLKHNFESCQSDLIYLCSIVKAELMYGAIKSANPKKNMPKLKRFLEGFVSLSFDDQCAEVYGEIRAQLEKEGNIIGPYDMMIAAVALRNNMTLISHNTREFSRIPLLDLDDWEIKTCHAD